MGVKSYFPWQAEQYIDSAGTEEVYFCLRNTRLTDLKLDNGDISARIFDAEGRAFKSTIQFISDGFLPSCDCSSTGPCTHAGTLLLHAYREHLLPRPGEYELEYLDEGLHGRKQASNAGGEPDLFSLFDDEPGEAPSRKTGTQGARGREGAGRTPAAGAQAEAAGGAGRDAEAKAGEAGGGAEGWDARRGNAGKTGRDADAKAGEAGGGAEGGDAEGGDAEGGDAEGGDAEGGDAEGGDAGKAGRDAQTDFAEGDSSDPPLADMSPLLKIHGNSGGTGIEVFFRYPWGEVCLREARHVFTIETPDGGEAEYSRNLNAENEFFHRVRDLISQDLIFERGIYADLFKEGPQQDLQINCPPSEFLLDKGRVLLDEGLEVRVENRRVRTASELHFSVNSDLDILGIQAMVKGPEGIKPIRDFGPDTRERGLVDVGGEYALLRDSDIRQLEYLQRRGMSNDGALTTSAVNMVLLERIYDQLVGEDRAVVGDLLESGRQLEDTHNLPPVPVPGGLKTTLRNYQQYGYSWLNFMLERGMNPCLADDMGLGKTVQTLSLMLKRREQGVEKPGLIVCPVVTLANWEAEARRFAPDLNIVVHRGEGRADDLADMDGNNIILTSYHTLRNDIALFVDRQFDIMVLDEAHYIKNIQSQIFKTVRSISADHRISLTGTPIENSVMELFAQMDFLNPGLLGTPRQFYSDFFRGIQREGDENLLDELKDLVRPFILRRTKDEVLGELPGKEIITRFIDMAPDQREKYDAQRELILCELEAEDDASLRGTLMFTSLLKLRQLAIHPPLADPAYRGVASAKLEALELLMNDILREDHKVLIFSQFIGSLEAISALCERRKWGHVLLTGQTANRDREVAEFQNNPDVRVFLLSLKAGGVGINLTAADYVVIFDPWWNPAAEQQAIDRAHRMGQTRQVMAYKLITRDSIEEKILKLQEQKSNLADEIINSGGSLLSHLGRDEMLRLFS